MNLNAIGLGPIVPERLPERGPADGASVHEQPGHAPGVPPRGDSVTTGEHRPGGPKADADTRLWGVLSGEERGFYLRHAMKGEATYRPETQPSASTHPGARLGVRIDMRI